VDKCVWDRELAYQTSASQLYSDVLKFLIVHVES
jgi:hypothetical protein